MKHGPRKHSLTPKDAIGISGLTGKSFPSKRVTKYRGTASRCDGKKRAPLRPDGPWSDAGMAIESEITLTNQERGKEWEYRVLAVNKAGEGQPSNTVMAVL